MSYRMGVDIGGTFTDFALIDDSSGRTVFGKRLTTPDDPSRAVLEGISAILEQNGVAVPSLTAIIHGSTLVTNAVIERKGASTGMLVTKGFKDVLDIALERRYDLYDLRLRLPDPIVPRDLRVEVRERMHEDGSVLEALDADEIRAAVEALVRDEKITSLAICFLHSFTNAGHEDEAARIVAERFPSLYVTTSASVLPFMREYERWTTAGINAFVQPLVDQYLSRIEQGLKDIAFAGDFYVMTSSGGTVSSDIARRYPVRMLESGPAAGVLMAAHVGRAAGISNLLSFDMGGTTAKGSIVRGGHPSKKYEIEVARVHEFRGGSGLPVKIPVIDMIEIGAGGGGIANIDSRGLLRVGPRSAGADPGPACYGRGGENATLTDANLVLGYYDANAFLGGTMALDPGASRRVIDATVAKDLALDTIRAAWGIHETINEDVARAFRVHASEIGFDYRRCSMVAFGGSGPAHAARIARKLRIPKVIYPVGTGVMSAIGMLVSPLSFQLARTHRVYLKEIEPAAFAAFFSQIEADARAILFGSQDPVGGIVTVRRYLDMRYEGQGYEIEVELPQGAEPGELLVAAREAFDQAYRKIFALGQLDEAVEILNWKVEVVGATPKAPSGQEAGEPEAPSPRAFRSAFFPESGFIECPVFDRYAIGRGHMIEGPAFIEERESTCVLGAGDRASLDNLGNLVAEIGALAQ